MLIRSATDIVNTAHIAHVEDVTPAGRGERSLVTFADGTKRTVGIGLWGFEQACGVIVPAQPGFTIIRALMPGIEGAAVTYVDEPVIAFRIAAGTADDIMPIAVTGEPTTLGNVRWTVRQPSGRCAGPDGEHDTIKVFKADCEREAVAARRSAA